MNQTPPINNQHPLYLDFCAQLAPIRAPYSEREEGSPIHLIGNTQNADIQRNHDENVLRHPNVNDLTQNVDRLMNEHRQERLRYVLSKHLFILGLREDFGSSTVLTAHAIASVSMEFFFAKMDLKFFHCILEDEYLKLFESYEQEFRQLNPQSSSSQVFEHVSDRLTQTIIERQNTFSESSLPDAE